MIPNTARQAIEPAFECEETSALALGFSVTAQDGSNRCVYVWVDSQRAAATFMSIRGQGLPLSERLVDMNDETGPTGSHSDGW